MNQTIVSEDLKCSVHGCKNTAAKFWIIRGTKPQMKYPVCRECKDKLRQFKKPNGQ